ncbi:MAG: FimB/Mfa2 family fimbrial subunit [Bacteroides xylanisolvens]
MKQILIYLCFWGLTGCMLASCDHEDLIESNSGFGMESSHNDVTFLVSIPTTEDPATYAGIVAEDCRIDALDVYVFKDDDSYVQCIRSIPESSSSGQNYISFKISLSDEGDYNFILVANPDNLDSIEEPPTSKEDLQKKLIYTHTNNNPILTPVPMYCETGLIKVEEGGGKVEANQENESLVFTRMVARIDVILSDEAKSNFTLSKVHLCKAKHKGFVAAPASGLNIPEDADTVSISYNYNVSNTPAIYAFESPKASSDSDPTASVYADATCLVLEGKYKDGETCFYRVNLKTNEGEYLDISRNHQYKVKIAKIKGYGYATRDIALKSPEVRLSTNTAALTCESNGRDYKYVYFNEDYLLKLQEISHTYENTGGNQEERYVTTYQGEMHLSSKVSWITNLRFYNQYGSTSFKFRTEKNTTKKQRTGIIRISAGLLHQDITIIQNP